MRALLKELLILQRSQLGNVRLLLYPKQAAVVVFLQAAQRHLFFLSALRCISQHSLTAFISTAALRPSGLCCVRARLRPSRSIISRGTTGLPCVHSCKRAYTYTAGAGSMSTGCCRASLLRAIACADQGRQRRSRKPLSQFSFSETEDRGQSIIHDTAPSSYTYTQLTHICSLQNIRLCKD